MKTIIHVTTVAAPRERVYEALTTIDGLASWWTTTVSGEAANEGALIAFTFDGDFNPQMRVTELSAPSIIDWECVAGVEQWAEKTFRFELEERDGGTVLRFRQEYANELSDEDYGTYNYNWGYYLDSLRVYCETGTGKPYAMAQDPRSDQGGGKAARRRCVQPRRPGGL
jgi:uncharacterized protein YndB with AHSA1/START domain